MENETSTSNMSEGRERNTPDIFDEIKRVYS